MNRIDRLFQQLTSSSRKAFVAYLVGGDPSPQATPQLVRTTIASLLGAVSEVRRTHDQPLIFFTYFNPIFRYGTKKFLADAHAAGIDGILILDLPPEEASSEWPRDCPLKRISLLAPTTPAERVSAIVAHSSGFLYYVSRAGVTGMQKNIASDIEDRISLIRSKTSLPLCVGFGISNPEQASQVAHLADGVVVGSAIVNQIATHAGDPHLARIVGEFVRPIAEAIHRS